MKISALIIARNEQDKIERTLKSLEFADEIVIVLDRSEDETKKISRKYTNKIFSGSWNLEGDRRNFGINKCSSEWIIEIDADEIVSEELCKEIKDKIKQDKFDFFYIPIRNYVGQRVIEFGWMACMAPDGKFSLFRKGFKYWGDGRVHPDYNVKGRKGEKFSNPIFHYMSKDISDLIGRFNKNTSLHSLDLRTQKKNLKKLFSIRKIFSRFFKCYFSRKGYRSGKIGFLVGLLCSIYPIVSAIKASKNNGEI